MKDVVQPQEGTLDGQAAKQVEAKVDEGMQPGGRSIMNRKEVDTLTEGRWRG